MTIVPSESVAVDSNSTEPPMSIVVPEIALTPPLGATFVGSSSPPSSPSPIAAATAAMTTMTAIITANIIVFFLGSSFTSVGRDSAVSSGAVSFSLLATIKHVLLPYNLTPLYSPSGGQTRSDNSLLSYLAFPSFRPCLWPRIPKSTCWQVAFVYKRGSSHRPPQEGSDALDCRYINIMSQRVVSRGPSP